MTTEIYRSNFLSTFLDKQKGPNGVIGGNITYTDENYDISYNIGYNMDIKETPIHFPSYLIGKTVNVQRSTTNGTTTVSELFDNVVDVTNYDDSKEYACKLTMKNNNFIISAYNIYDKPYSSLNITKFPTNDFNIYDSKFYILINNSYGSSSSGFLAFYTIDMINNSLSKIIVPGNITSQENITKIKDGPGNETWDITKNLFPDLQSGPPPKKQSSYTLQSILLILIVFVFMLLRK